jgi:hypothetical protein
MTTAFPAGPCFDWRQREIAQIDEALTVYATRRHELDLDGQGLARRVVVDEMLDQRLQLQAEIRQRRPRR